MIETINKETLIKGCVIGFKENDHDEMMIGQIGIMLGPNGIYEFDGRLFNCSGTWIDAESIKIIYAVPFPEEGCFFDVVDDTLVACPMMEDGTPDMDDEDMNWCEVDEFSDINDIAKINETFGTCYV